jgi:superfamily I DNA/RNA helicase
VKRKTDRAGETSKGVVVNVSKYLASIFDRITNGKSNLMVEALAGCGKTTAICESLRRMGPAPKALVLAFGKPIQQELEDRQRKGLIPRSVWLKTSHSFGLGAINAAVGRGRRVRVDEKKYEKILWSMVAPMPDQERGEFWRAFGTDMTNLTRYGRNSLANDVKDLEKIAAHHGLSMIPQAIGLAWEAIEKGRKDFQVIDFADMVYLPVFRKLRVTQFDDVFVDEAQDLSAAQRELAAMAGGRCIFVGDRNQSIFGFAGAGTDSMDRIVNRFQPEVMPLPMTYRCGKAIVEFANEVLKRKGAQFLLEAAPGNPEGAVETIKKDKFLNQVADGDMVLCRVTKYLVSPCFALIRQGIKATIRGRDIGKQLVQMIERFEGVNLPETLAAIQAYGDKECEKLSACGHSSKAVAMEDRVETIYALSDGVSTVLELINKIEAVFSDDVEGVVFSTVHKAKGLEAKKVYILEPGLFPHPMAKMEWEKEQELNLEFVAKTRAIELVSIVESARN